MNTCFDFSFLLSHRSVDTSLLLWTNFFSSFVDALRLNSASITSRRAWLTFSFSRTSFTSCTTCCTAYLLLSHRLLTLYIRLSFSALDTTWSVRRVSIYIKTTSPVLISLTWIYSVLPGLLWVIVLLLSVRSFVESSYRLTQPIVAKDSLWKSPAPCPFEEALQKPPRPLCPLKTPFKEPLSTRLKSLRLSLPESSVTIHKWPKPTNTSLENLFPSLKNWL